MTLRVLIALAGIALAGVGVHELADDEYGDLLGTATWLVAGVLLHDAVLAPVVIGLGMLAAILFPSWLRGPAAAGFVVLGTVTLVAVPVLGRFGALPDNPTLLDGDYRNGWLLLAAITVGGVVVVATRNRLHNRGARGHSQQP